MPHSNPLILDEYIPRGEEDSDREPDVYVCPLNLELAIGLKPSRAKEVGRRVFDAAKKRWPRARIALHRGNPDYVGHFIELGGYHAAGYVHNRDIDMRRWDEEGARLKASVLNKFLIDALQVHREYTDEELHEVEAAFTKRLKAKSK